LTSPNHPTGEDALLAPALGTTGPMPETTPRTTGSPHEHTVLGAAVAAVLVLAGGGVAGALVLG
jgi:hypothetical protein